MKEFKLNLNIILSIIIFCTISIISIYSAKPYLSINLSNIYIKQIILYGIGIILLLLSYRFKDIILKYSFIIYLGLNILLIALLFFGISVNGSKCWFFIGSFGFQPSEFMKITLIIVLSTTIVKHDKKYSKKKEFILVSKLFLITIIPSILTFLEPDTGVVIIYLIILLTILIIRGVNKKLYLFMGISLLIIITNFVILYIFQQDLLIKIIGNNIFYRVERLLSWSTQSGYQLENSLIAIGASGLIGFGFNKIPIYYPEPSTDFIFTTYTSNFGFLGALFLILTIILFDMTILKLISKKIKKIDKYILIGILGMITYQQIQNISMTIGLLPITGITLPFISYGGCSLLSYMIITGIILNIIKEKNYFFN